MAKLTKATVFKASASKSETPMDKTTRIVRGIVDAETEQRQDKIARLRKAPLEREAHTPPETLTEARKTRPSKAVTK